MVSTKIQSKINGHTLDYFKTTTIYPGMINPCESNDIRAKINNVLSDCCYIGQLSSASIKLFINYNLISYNYISSFNVNIHERDNNYLVHVVATDKHKNIFSAARLI